MLAENVGKNLPEPAHPSSNDVNGWSDWSSRKLAKCCATEL